MQLEGEQENQGPETVPGAPPLGGAGRGARGRRGPGPRVWARGRAHAAGRGSGRARRGSGLGGPGACGACLGSGRARRVSGLAGGGTRGAGLSSESARTPRVWARGRARRGPAELWDEAAAGRERRRGTGAAVAEEWRREAGPRSLGSRLGRCGLRRPGGRGGEGRARGNPPPHLTAGGARGPQHAPRGEGSPPARGLRRRRRRQGEAACGCRARRRERGRRRVPAAGGGLASPGRRRLPPPGARAERRGGLGAPTWRPGAPRAATCGSSGCTATGATSAATTSTTRRPRRSCTSWRASAWCTARASTGRSSTGATATTSSGTRPGGGRRPPAARSGRAPRPKGEARGRLVPTLPSGHRETGPLSRLRTPSLPLGSLRWPQIGGPPFSLPQMSAVYRKLP